MIGGLSKLNRYLLAGAGVIGILAVSTAASAQDLKAIQAQINSMQATIKALQKQVADAKAQAAAAQTTAADAKGSDLDLKVKWKGAPELSRSDGKFKFKVRGQLETDYNNINQDTPITTFPDVSARSCGVPVSASKASPSSTGNMFSKSILRAAAGSFVTGTSSTGSVTNDTVASPKTPIFNTRDGNWRGTAVIPHRQFQDAQHVRG